MADEKLDNDAGEADDLDVSLEPVLRKKSGAGWGTVVIVLVLIVTVALLALAYQRGVQRAAQERADRENLRSMGQQKIGTDLLAAADKVKAGDFKAGVKALNDAALAVASLVQEAEAAGDTEAADILKIRQVALDAAKKKLADQQAAIDAIMAEAVAALESEATAVSGGRVRPAPTPEAAPAAPAETPAPPAPPGAAPPVPAPPAPAPAPAPPAPAPAPPAATVPPAPPPPPPPPA